MRTRRLPALAVLAASIALTGCASQPVACPAIGFVYPDPVIVQIDPTVVGAGTVAACLGEGCQPVALEPTARGRWEVPPEPPFAPKGTIGVDPGAGIRIAVLDAAGTTVRDEWFEIPYTSRSNGACPAPVEFQPVVVS